MDDHDFLQRPSESYAVREGVIGGAGMNHAVCGDWISGTGCDCGFIAPSCSDDEITAASRAESQHSASILSQRQTHAGRKGSPLSPEGLGWAADAEAYNIQYDTFVNTDTRSQFLFEVLFNKPKNKDVMK